MTHIDFRVLRTCLRCLGPITMDGLPCPNPDCPVGYRGPTWRQPVHVSSMNAATFTEVPVTPVVKEVVYQKRLGVVMYPTDWLVPSRPAWVWWKE